MLLIYYSTIVILSAVSEASKESIILKIKCYQIKYTSAFKIEAAINGERQQDVLCNNTNTVQLVEFNELSCSTSYNMSIYWKSSNASLEVQCLLYSNIEKPLLCKSYLNIKLNLLITILVFRFMDCDCINCCTIIYCINNNNTQYCHLHVYLLLLGQVSA